MKTLCHWPLLPSYNFMQLFIFWNFGLYFYCRSILTGKMANVSLLLNHVHVSSHNRKLACCSCVRFFEKWWSVLVFSGDMSISCNIFGVAVSIISLMSNIFSMFCILAV